VGTHFLSSFVPAVRNCPVVVAHRCASPSRDYCPGYGTVGQWNHTPHAAHVGQNSKIFCRKFPYREVRPAREAPLPAKGLVRRLRRKPGNSWANRAGRTGKGRSAEPTSASVATANQWCEPRHRFTSRAVRSTPRKPSPRFFAGAIPMTSAWPAVANVGSASYQRSPSTLGPLAESR